MSEVQVIPIPERTETSEAFGNECRELCAESQLTPDRQPPPQTKGWCRGQ